jgi:hypothetical protein
VSFITYSIFLFFCVVLCVFTFWVPCGDVRYNFHIKSMFDSSLPSVVCWRAQILFMLLVFVWFVFTFSCLLEGSNLVYVISVYLHLVVSNTYCVVFLFCLSSSMLPVSLDCPFLIAPSVFFNMYLNPSLDYSTLINQQKFPILLFFCDYS